MVDAPKDPDRSPIFDDFADLLRAAEEPERQADYATQTIAFFDLVGSTARKLVDGHMAGVRAALTHNRTCRAAVERCNGRIVKELGDGALAVFDDPMDAVLAAINFRAALALADGLQTRIGMTIGRVEQAQIAGADDVLGSAVDRCARVQAAAGPGEIVMDEPLAEVIQSYVTDYDGYAIAGPEAVPLAGVGNASLYAVVTGNSSAASAIREVFAWNESGRLLVTEKAAFISRAQHEIVELGTGLTTFASYFDQTNPGLFRDPVFATLARGVAMRCFALDPESAAASSFLADRSEPDYVDRIRDALVRLGRVREDVAKRDWSGSFELSVYAHIPSFYVLGIDLGDDEPSDHGAMMVSNYLFGVERAQTPVMRLSRTSNPTLFDRYWAATRAITAGARPA